MNSISPRPVMRIPVNFIILALGMVLALPARGVYSEAADAAPVGDADFDAGFRAVKAAEWRVAIDRLQRAANRHPRSADIHNLLGIHTANPAISISRSNITTGRLNLTRIIAARMNISVKPG